MSKRRAGDRQRPNCTEQQAALIIGTNDYSIVSKRSVENLYYSHHDASSNPNSDPDSDIDSQAGQLIEPFVGKAKRRTPIINRGYWLRMRAITAVVGQFLKQETDRNKKKVVVNLGCGYEPLPFRSRRCWPDLCNDTLFIDIDYPACIAAKRNVLLANKEIFGLHDVLVPGLDSGVKSPVALSTRDGYYAVGCDLANTADLERILKELVPAHEEREILFVAEVSVTYVGVEGANRLIDRLSSFPNARFCSLEQCLPDGPSHPFARTMLSHFGKQTPLKSIEHYPTTESQVSRFLDLGWRNASAVTMWEMWQDKSFVPDSVRARIDQIEPFDEWEEFALFAGHYFVLSASSNDTPFVPFHSFDGASQACVLSSRTGCESGDQLPAFEVQFHSPPSLPFESRFGALGQHSSSAVSVLGGLSSSSQSAPWDLWRDVSGEESSDVLPVPQNSSPLNSTLPNGLCCHTISQIPASGADEEKRHLIVGGRKSPSKTSAQCWVLSDTSLEPVQTLVPARYRHSAVPVTLPACQNGGAVLIFGGRTAAGLALAEFCLWTRDCGWRTLDVLSEKANANANANANWNQSPICARFSTQMISYGPHAGLLFGGLDQSGIVCRDIWEWTLAPDGSSIKLSQVDCSTVTNPGLLFRFGGEVVPFSKEDSQEDGQSWMAIGGVGADGVLPVDAEIALIRRLSSGRWHVSGTQIQYHTDRPLLVGTSAARVSQRGCDDGRVLIAGGGAVCFSFGSCFNSGAYELIPASSPGSLPPSKWVCHSSSNTLVNAGASSTSQSLPPPDFSSSASNIESPANRHKAEHLIDAFKVNLPTTPIPTIPLPVTSAEFWSIVEAGRPVVFSKSKEGSQINLGPCLERWQDPDYLVSKIDLEHDSKSHTAGESEHQQPHHHPRKLIIHTSNTSADPHLSFSAKNFTYERASAADLLSRAAAGEPVYFRAVSTTAPTKAATRLSDDFPGLAPDFQLPDAIAVALGPEQQQGQQGDRKSATGSKLHSSVLRISGAVTIWVHYDVLANVLCQVTGRKRVVVFDPVDVEHLDFAPGFSTTTGFSAFGGKWGKEGRQGLDGLTGYETVLGPCDILFLPSCWPHTTAPVIEPDLGDKADESACHSSCSLSSSPSSGSSSFLSTAVNVFFHNLPSQAYQTGRDVYANRDPDIYEWARKTVARRILGQKDKNAKGKKKGVKKDENNDDDGNEQRRVDVGRSGATASPDPTGSDVRSAFLAMFERQMWKKEARERGGDQESEARESVKESGPDEMKEIPKTTKAPGTAGAKGGVRVLVPPSVPAPVIALSSVAADVHPDRPSSTTLPHHSLPSHSLSSRGPLPDQICNDLSQIASRIANAPVTERMARFYALRIGAEIAAGWDGRAEG